MQNPRELRRRIRTVVNIERTVDALEKISAARLARERGMLAAVRPYTAALVAALSEMAASGQSSHPLLDVRESESYMLLVIGSDRGMCGAYNTALMRAAAEFVATRRRDKLFLLTSGTKLRRLRPRAAELVIRETLRYPRPLSSEHVEEIARTITEAYLTDNVARVYFAYTEFRGATGNRPVVRRVLPLMPPRQEHAPEWLFEPSAAAVLEQLLPLYVRTTVRQAFLEAGTSEHAARMVSMEQASASARRMIDGLTLTANKLRQGLITRELSDIVGTVEALSS